MTTHHLKIWPHFFNDLESGMKTFELRRDDRGYQVGDLLVLEEYVTEGHTYLQSYYTGRKLYREIVYILKGYEGLTGKHAILGLKEIKRREGDG